MSDYFPLMQTALGGALSIAGGIAALFVREQLRVKTDRRRMASAFAGEMKAVLELAAARRIREVLEEGRQRYQSGKTWPAWDWSIERDYVGVYRAHPDKIGLFDPPIPGRIAEFYTHTFALMEALTHTGTQTWHLEDRGYMLRTFEENLLVLTKLESVGGETIAMLQSIARA